MAEEYQILISAAEASGRESYITDKDFEVVWTNADEPLAKVLLGLRTPLPDRDLRRETVLSCTDGRALKITPIRGEEGLRYCFFELYGSSELLMMLGKTSVFSGFIKAAENMRYSMLDYAGELSVSADAVNRSRYGRLCSSSVNFMSILRILGGSGIEGAQDMTARLRQTACWFAAVSARTEKFLFEADIDEELYAVTEKSALECAVTNLLMNGFLHAVPPEGKQLKLTVAAYADSGKVVIDVDDNGCKADPAYVDGFRNVYLTPCGDSGGEGLGVSLAEVFCRRFGGELRFMTSPLGGLRARISLPACDPRRTAVFFAPSSSESDFSQVHDIMLKGFTEADIEDIF